MINIDKAIEKIKKLSIQKFSTRGGRIAGEFTCTGIALSESKSILPTQKYYMRGKILLESKYLTLDSLNTVCKNLKISTSEALCLEEKPLDEKTLDCLMQMGFSKEQAQEKQKELQELIKFIKK